jgi:hypothetical protein
MFNTLSYDLLMEFIDDQALLKAISGKSTPARASTYVSPGTVTKKPTPNIGAGSQQFGWPTD